MKLALGLYGLYLLLVAIRGNGKELTNDLSQDMGQFLPWLVVAAILGYLYNNQETHNVAKAFIVLVVISFVYKNINNLKSQAKSIYNEATGNSSTTAATTASSVGQPVAEGPTLAEVNTMVHNLLSSDWADMSTGTPAAPTSLGLE